MRKYSTHNNTYRYIDVLDQVLHSYNHTCCSIIIRAFVKLTPENESDVWLTLYEDMRNINRKFCVFQAGDVLSVFKHILTFEKESETSWTEELFLVTECVRDPARPSRISYQESI